jgi:hypothetical protein
LKQRSKDEERTHPRQQPNQERARHSPEVATDLLDLRA